MIGPNYWSTGILVTYIEGGTGGPVAAPEPRLWAAKAEFFDNGFCEIRSTEGEIHTRYSCPTIEEAIDLVKADVERLGIEWRPGTIYMRGDGEDEEFPPPADWRRIVNQQAERLGWEPSYRLETPVADAGERTR